MSAFIITVTANDYSTELNYELETSWRGSLYRVIHKLWTLLQEMIS